MPAYIRGTKTLKKLTKLDAEFETKSDSLKALKTYVASKSAARTKNLRNFQLEKSIWNNGDKM